MEPFRTGSINGAAEGFITRPRLLIRCVAGVVLAVFFITARYRAHIDLPIGPLLGLCFIEILSYPLYWGLLRRIESQLVQAYCLWLVDLAVITAGIHFLGGVEAILFAWLYILIIVASGIASRQRDAYFLAFLSIVGLTTVIVLEDQGLIEHYTVFSEATPRGQMLFSLPFTAIIFFLIASYAGVLSRNVRKRGESLSALRDLGQVVNASLELDQTLNHVIRSAAEMLSARGGVLRLLDEKSGLMEIEKEFGNVGSFRKHWQLTARDALVEMLVRRRAPTLIADAKKDPRTTQLGIDFFSSIISAPLVSQDELIGILSLMDRAGGLGRRNRFNREDLLFLVNVSNQATQAIANARLHTNLDKADRRLKAAQDSVIQSEKLASLAEMGNNVAHHVRNPLLAIGTSARRILDKFPDGSKERRYTHIIVDETAKLENILQNLLLFSRGAERPLEPLDIRGTIERILDAVFEKAGSTGITIVKELLPKHPIVLGDPPQIDLVFLNIFTNTREAMGESGSLTVRTTNRSDDPDRPLWIEVSDTAGGMSQEVVENLFNPFFTTKHWGTGLGLSTALRIVENHCGRLEVVNRPGSGVTFLIKLPVAGS